VQWKDECQESKIDHQHPSVAAMVGEIESSKVEKLDIEGFMFEEL